MRKAPLVALAASAALLLVGCARLGPDPVPSPQDLLFLRTSKGLTLVKALPEAVAVPFSGGVPSLDWSAVARGTIRGDETHVVAFDTSSGQLRWSRDVPGRYEVKVASGEARLVALGPRSRSYGGYPAGRSTTTLVILGGSAAPREIALEGNYEPEAFSTDGETLFVVEYLPAQRPTSYRVRQLDLSTGVVGGVYSVDSELQESMQGTARIQAASPDGSRLYTLYSLDGGHGASRTFVHVLSLDEKWAHCVDLPESFGNAAQQGVALSVSPDGSRAYVADAASGSVAEIDTDALTVTRSANVDFGSTRRPMYAAPAADGALYLASGDRLLAVDPSTMSPGRSWEMLGRITGIQVGEGTGRVYVGLRDRIEVFDTRTGDRLEELNPDIGSIDQLGQSTRILLEEEQSSVSCAC
jgi:hypothetical protein